MQMTEGYPQCRIVPMRMLNPDTTKSLLDQVVAVPGIRRILLNGQNLPVVVPYGPARGAKNPHSMRKSIRVADSDVDLHVQVGTITIELEDREVTQKIRAICDEFFVKFSCTVQEGRFMKSEPSLVDYAKYGPGADKSMVGLVDPKRKEQPSVIRFSRDQVCGWEI
ncbi:MAG: methyl-coenzyme M reductase operon protein D [Methanoregula sp.]|jgi:methyl-coenzyme M reductase subunit D